MNERPDHEDEQPAEPSAPWYAAAAEPEPGVLDDGGTVGASDPAPSASDPWGPPLAESRVDASASTWAPPTAETPSVAAAAEPTAASAPAVEPDARPRRGRQFVAGIALGAVVGGLVGGGVAAVVGRGESRTVVQQPNPVVTEARNTSRLAVARDIQGIVGRVEPAVVSIRTGAAVDDGLFSGRGSSSGEIGRAHV